MAIRFDPHRYAAELADSESVASDRQLLYRWQGTHWQAQRDEDSERDAYSWIVKHDREHASPGNARMAYNAAALWAPALPVPTETVVIPCRNGYVHVEDGALAVAPPAKDLGLQHVIACDFVRGAPGPEFSAFLEQVLPDSGVRARVQEYIGYTLTADARYHRAQVWLGGGANGKGVLANIVQALHGSTAAVSLDALEGFRLSVLIGASLIYCDELPRARINEQLLKSMIAGERIQVDRKYRDPLSINIRGKWLVVGNHLPTITDHSLGFWRRLDVVPFDVTIPLERQDPLLASRIKQRELAAVLNWALDGLVRLQRRGAFDPDMPQAMVKILQTAKTHTNSVIAWYEDADVLPGENVNTPKDAVYQHYRLWCEANGLRQLAAQLFWTRLRDICGVQEERRRVNDRHVRVCNIELAGQDAAGRDLWRAVGPAAGRRPPRQDLQH